MVNLPPWPSGILNCGRLVFRWGNEGPKFSTFLEVNFTFYRVAAVSHTRVRRAHGDPYGKVRNYSVGELALGRHFEFAIVVNGLDQPAFTGIARDDYRAGVTAIEDALFGIEKKAALEVAGIGGVTLVTVVRQHRPDVFLEKLDAFRVGVSSCRLAKRNNDERPGQSHRYVGSLIHLGNPSDKIA